MDGKGSARNVILVVIGVVLILILIAGMFFYFALAGKNYDAVYAQRVASGELVSPVAGLSLEEKEAVEEAVEEFDDDFVYYLAYSLKAYNLHEPPLSSNKPKLEVLVDDDIYNVIIEEGEIIVEKGQLEEKDAVIRTSAEEVVKMLVDKEYIRESFEEGGLDVEFVEEKSTLFAKGYLKIYGELSGEGVTGNVVRIYVS
tara:strand:- start:2322 stop:2918 length:597 start_codon:yes stop_codon:yes gene_type:complete